MQSPNFPNEVFGVLFNVGSKEEPSVRITPIPARFNKSTISTINKRRIAMDKLGKIETIAETNTLHIVRVWLINREEIPATIERMHQYVSGVSQKKLEAVNNMVLKLSRKPEVTERDYED